MPPISIPTRRTWIAALDPTVPLDSTDRRYVDLDSVPGARRGNGKAATEELFRTIEFAEAEGESCQLFTGYPGSGKTTELSKLKRLLEDSLEATHVVVVDAEQYLDAYVPPSITDLLRILAFALDREAIAARGGDPDKSPGYVSRLWTWLQSDLELKEIGYEKWGVQIMAEIKANPSFHEKVETRLGQSFQAFAAEARSVAATAIEDIRSHLKVRRVVLLVDGLEKFQPLRPSDHDNMERAVEAVFHQHAAYLALPCHVVLTFPYWLRWHTVGLGQAYDAPPVVLPMVKVCEQDGSPNEVGIDKLEELIGRRVDLTAVFGPRPSATLRELLSATGGYPRDVLRLTRDVLRATDVFPVTPEVVSGVVGRLAGEYELVALRSDAAVLAHLARTRSLPDGEEGLRAAGRLIQLYLVLTYRNGVDWYDLHPLVRRSPRVQQLLAGI